MNTKRLISLEREGYSEPEALVFSGTYLGIYIIYRYKTGQK